MLSRSDIEFIKANRAELTANRTETIIAVVSDEDGTDPFTNEPIVSEAPISVDVVWKKIASVANHDRSLVEGVELRKGDVRVTFDADVDLAKVVKLIRNGVDYVLLTADEKGIGEVNRRECIVRRVI